MKTDARDLDVIIVGGGIGGVTLGLMLHRAGIVARCDKETLAASVGTA
jgi:cation diffusion facilitator CzcD-associated flavoprotein CzcO